MPRWKSAPERFWAKVDRSGECWEWLGAASDTGYGCFYDGRPWSAHRYSYAIHHGPIPGGFVVMHSCDNRRCVNPDHLDVGRHADNSRDMVTKGRGRGPRLKGEAHGEAKLTDDAVIAIRTTDATLREMAARYGVSESAVSLVRRGLSWRHITPEVIAKRLAQGVLDFGGAS